MNIVQVHNNYRVRGGEDVVVMETVRLLRDRGVRVRTLIRNSTDLPGGAYGRLRAFVSGIYSPGAYRVMSGLIREELPSVVHIHNLYPLISPAILLACRRQGIPVVMTCHNGRLFCPVGLFSQNNQPCSQCVGGREYHCILNNCRNNFFESISYSMRTLISRKSRLFLDNVTIFAAVSSFQKDQLVAAGLPESRVVVIPNMIQIPAEVSDHSGGEYIAYAGRLSREKGIDTLLQAVHDNKVPLRLAGDYSQLPDSRHRQSKHARFLGLLNRSELDNFYRQARFMVFPSSLPEPGPLAVLEAMSHGLPVIAARIGGNYKVVEEGVTGLLFEPRNAADLAAKIKLLWQDKELCRRLGGNAREQATAEHSPDVHYGRLMGAYRQAIEMGKAQRVNE